MLAPLGQRKRAQHQDGRDAPPNRRFGERNINRIQGNQQSSREQTERAGQRGDGE